MAGSSAQNEQGRLWPLLVVVIALAAAALAWSGKGAASSRASGAARPVVAPEAGWMPAIPSDRWQCIVIHHSATEAGGAKRFDEAHRERGWDELGYHFVIGNGSESKDGEVEVGPRWITQKHGAHCKTDDSFYNEHGIGICLVGNLDNHRPTAKQLASLERLVRFAAAEFHIPASQVLTHGLVTGKTKCPGKYLDLQAIRRTLANQR